MSSQHIFFPCFLSCGPILKPKCFVEFEVAGDPSAEADAVGATRGDRATQLQTRQRHRGPGAPV